MCFYPPSPGLSLSPSRTGLCLFFCLLVCPISVCLLPCPALPSRVRTGGCVSPQLETAALFPLPVSGCSHSPPLIHIASPARPSRYNTVGLPVAAGVLFPLTKITLPPMLAGLAMVRRGQDGKGEFGLFFFFLANKDRLNREAGKPSIVVFVVGLLAFGGASLFAQCRLRRWACILPSAGMFYVHLV